MAGRKSDKSLSLGTDVRVNSATPPKAEIKSAAGGARNTVPKCTLYRAELDAKAGVWTRSRPIHRRRSRLRLERRSKAMDPEPVRTSSAGRALYATREDPSPRNTVKSPPDVARSAMPLHLSPKAISCNTFAERPADGKSS